MDGRQNYESKEVAAFGGLITAVKPSKEAFPDDASPKLKNVLNKAGILESRKGRQRVNDTAYPSTITSLVSYVDRNSVAHNIFSVQNNSEGNETPNGTLEDEKNSGSRHALIAQWELGTSYIVDVKIRGDYLYVAVLDTATGYISSLKKYSTDGVLISTMSTPVANKFKNTFDVDDQGNVYFYQVVTAGNDRIVKCVWGSVTVTASYTLGATPIPCSFIKVIGSNVYVAYNTGTNAVIDKLSTALVLVSTPYNVVTTDLTTSLTITKSGTMFFTSRDAAGTSRKLWYKAVAWTQVLGEFNNLPTFIASIQDKLYLSLLDDTITGASQAMFYVYTSSMEYQERLGTAYLSAASKNKPWDIASIVANEVGTIANGRLIFDVDSEGIYFVDAVSNSGSPIGVVLTIKKFRR